MDKHSVKDSMPATAEANPKEEIGKKHIAY